MLTKGLVLKGSISSMCSPVPMNVMGLWVAATLRERGGERGKQERKKDENSENVNTDTIEEVKKKNRRENVRESIV